MEEEVICSCDACRMPGREPFRYIDREIGLWRVVAAESGRVHAATVCDGWVESKMSPPTETAWLPVNGVSTSATLLKLERVL